jgi:hypothetical protein
MVSLFGRGRFSVPACTHGERRAERPSRMAVGHRHRRRGLTAGSPTVRRSIGPEPDATCCRGLPPLALKALVNPRARRRRDRGLRHDDDREAARARAARGGPDEGTVWDHFLAARSTAAKASAVTRLDAPRPHPASRGCSSAGWGMQSKREGPDGRGQAVGEAACMIFLSRHCGAARRLPFVSYWRTCNEPSTRSRSAGSAGWPSARQKLA